jgi:hypothetical protein
VLADMPDVFLFGNGIDVNYDGFVWQRSFFAGQYAVLSL